MKWPLNTFLNSLMSSLVEFPLTQNVRHPHFSCLLHVSVRWTSHWFSVWLSKGELSKSGTRCCKQISGSREGGGSLWRGGAAILVAISSICLTLCGDCSWYQEDMRRKCCIKISWGWSKDQVMNSDWELLLLDLRNTPLSLLVTPYLIIK